MNRSCLIPGSFDPVTIGHLDIIERAAKLFDTVYVTVFANTAKKAMFSPEQRHKLIELACEGMANVIPGLSFGLVSDYVREKNTGYIVKGVRGAVDFDYETQLFLIGRELCPESETLLLPAKPGLGFISSGFVRDMLIYRQDVSGYVPRNALTYLEKLVVENL